MHNSRQHSVKQYRPSNRDFNFATNHVHGQEIKQNSSEQRQRQHERKRQRHGAIKNNDRHNVDVRIVHPTHRRNEIFRDLGQQHEDEQNEEKNHFRPVTTKTSSRCDISTAGASFACPSSSRTRKFFTVPISSPDGNTPPTPEV